ncbi:prolyl oligopeptidase family serine peptidase [Emcibacter nanhaiensis]|uniref:S9 family peptidase n=1 Tax=Emcibacter nanhaiensis TaxID=1505037 RepID=A0A501PNL5_9PROT|nr:prolyl oligopeptidase family serine peptidase [Emcibacter nanhaiensis]TPD61758.1 S9 family peptidase [Emcibacter nanhaiensis]
MVRKKSVVSGLCAALLLVSGGAARAGQTTGADALDQSLLWLEEIQGDKALDWVRARNSRTVAEITADPRFDAFKQEAYDILTAEDRLAVGDLQGEYVYNFWQDEAHVRGIWRRSPVAAYRAGKPDWELLLDVDVLAAAEGENWVYKGANCLAPAYRRCIIELAPGGTDAAVYREFDLDTKSFVKGGFDIPLAKSWIDWLDGDILMVATDWGAPDSLNASGYPREMKILARGQKLSEASPLMKIDADETFIFPTGFYREEGGASFLLRGHSFFEFSYYVLDSDNQPRQLPIPRKLDLEGLFEGRVIIRIQEDWRGHKAGSLLAFPLKEFMESGQITTIEEIYDPGDSGTIRQVAIGKSSVVVNLLEDVSSRIRTFSLKDGDWSGSEVEMPGEQVLTLRSSTYSRDDMLLEKEGLLTPPSLYFVNFKEGVSEKLQSVSLKFDTKDLMVEKKFATSKDGTKVPYFLVYRKGVKLDGKTPVLQYGYGGFDISVLPRHKPVLGKLWLEKGGAYVIANIRGGGEYGPRWHEAALFEHRQRAYDDFFAVAEAVQASGISSPRHYGAFGRSNGGLLMGVSFTQRPDLFHGIICGVPLLDMKRYNKLLAGASWMGEYGNPDIPEQWAYIRKYSPFQNLKKDGNYPRVYFFTSTLDDRVHPGHARKMAAKMEAYGQPFFYYENIEGGHKGNANHDQEATMRALEYLYLWRELEGDD